MERYPDIKVELTLNDRFIDPIEEGFDLTIRIADLPDSGLIARKLTSAKRVICASPSYLKKNGIPKSLSELRNHCCLHYGYLATGNQWRLVGPEGQVSVQIKSILCSNNGEVLRDGAISGLGIVFLPTFIVGPDLQEGRLCTILADYEAPEINVYAVYPHNRHLSAKIRLLSQFLKDRFGDPPYWDLVL